MGSDPLIQTARGKLQSRRSKLNEKINKELRMRTGAENLFRAATNKKMRETVALELSFVNSNLQLLKEELAELNSEVEVYQNESNCPTVPMIPLGLKETTDIDFSTPFKDWIMEHYSEDSSLYENDLTELHNLRKAMRTPQRNQNGISLLFEFYNQLFFIEKRFFPSQRSLGIFFHWYDALTGVPCTQRTVGFEKGSVLFNIGALYSQIACRQDRTVVTGLSNAIVNFNKAAGAFKYLHDNFSHAPSMDMQTPTLNMLIALMIAQAQECVYERGVLIATTTDTTITSFSDPVTSFDAPVTSFQSPKRHSSSSSSSRPNDNRINGNDNHVNDNNANDGKDNRINGNENHFNDNCATNDNDRRSANDAGSNDNDEIPSASTTPTPTSQAPSSSSLSATSSPNPSYPSSPSSSPPSSRPTNGHSSNDCGEDRGGVINGGVVNGGVVNGGVVNGGVVKGDATDSDVDHDRRENERIKLSDETDSPDGQKALDLHTLLMAAQEAATVAEAYELVKKYLEDPPVKSYVPSSWHSICVVKSTHFRALSHHLTAVALVQYGQNNTEQSNSFQNSKTIERRSDGKQQQQQQQQHQQTIDNRSSEVKDLNFLLKDLHVEDRDVESGESLLATSLSSFSHDSKGPHVHLGKAHLREAILLHEDALRLHSLCKLTRKIDTLQDVLRTAHDRSVDLFARLEEEDDFSIIIDAPPIRPKTKVKCKPIRPEFTAFRVADIFWRLGPPAVFNARSEWSAPRLIEMIKESSEGFGFSVRGDTPVILALVEPGSIAEQAGILVGDLIVGVSGQDTKWAKHEEVVQLIRTSGNLLELQLVTPQPEREASSLTSPEYASETWKHNNNPNRPHNGTHTRSHSQPHHPHNDHSNGTLRKNGTTSRSSSTSSSSSSSNLMYHTIGAKTSVPSGAVASSWTQRRKEQKNKGLAAIFGGSGGGMDNSGGGGGGGDINGDNASGWFLKKRSGSGSPDTKTKSAPATIAGRMVSGSLKSYKQ